MADTKETRASRCVREWTQAEGNNQEKLALLLTARLGRVATGKSVAQSTISAIVRGRSIPHGLLMAALKAELGIEPEWWIEPPPASASSPSLPESDDAPAKTGT